MNNHPSVGATPCEQFYFEVAEQESIEKDRIIAELMRELQLQRQAPAVLKNITSIVDDIISLYPSFVDNDIHFENLAMVKGYEYANDIITYINKFKSSARILELLREELRGIAIETATYKIGSGGNTQYIHCNTKSSMIGFKGHDDRVHRTFHTLQTLMDSIIVETIKLGHFKRDASGPAKVWYAPANTTNKMSEFYVPPSMSDGIFYKSNEEHARVWELKKMFSTRLINVLLSYTEHLLQQL